MTLAFYMDVHVRREVTEGLRLRGIDVFTAQEDGTDRLPDPALLDRAMELGRVLYSQDADLLAEAAHRQQNGTKFAGIVYAHQEQITIGQSIRDLEIVANVMAPDEIANRVEYLPL